MMEKGIISTLTRRVSTPNSQFLSYHNRHVSPFEIAHFPILFKNFRGVFEAFRLELRFLFDYFFSPKNALNILSKTFSIGISIWQVLLMVIFGILQRKFENQRTENNGRSKM